MGFFSRKAVCAICDKEVGLNRYLVGKTLDGKEIWKCPQCAKKGNFVEVDLVTGKAKIKTEQETEVRNKCNACGHIYSYTAGDIERNKQHLKQAGLSSVAGMASALSGYATASSVNTGNANAELSRVVDYNRCPKCNSMDIKKLSKSEWEAEKAKANNGSSNVSAADELKKFKELLDSGVITQEEFDAKKKQLLGL